MTHKGWRVIKPQHNQSINSTAGGHINTFNMQSEPPLKIVSNLKKKLDWGSRDREKGEKVLY